MNGSTTLDRKCIYANPNSYPNSNHNTNSNPNPKAQLCFRTDEMTSFFDQVYRIQIPYFLTFHFNHAIYFEQKNGNALGQKEYALLVWTRKVEVGMSFYGLVTGNICQDQKTKK